MLRQVYGMNTKVYCSIPRPVLTVTVIIFIVLSLIFNTLVLKPDEIATRCIRLSQEIKSSDHQHYSLTMNVTLIAQHLRGKPTLNGEIQGACITRHLADTEKCSLRYGGSFPCYYSINQKDDTSVDLVFTKEQYQQQLSFMEKFSFGMTFITYVITTTTVVIVIVMLLAWKYHWDWRRAVFRLIREFIYQSFSLHPLEPILYKFDESDSPSTASFISLEDDTTSYRKRACEVLLRNTVMRAVAEPHDDEERENQQEPSLVITEKVLWHYAPTYREMLKSRYSVISMLILLPVISVFIMIVIIFQVSVMASIGAIFFGLSFSLVLLLLPAGTSTALIFHLGKIFGSNYFITNYRSIVLIELPLKLGFVIKYSIHSDVARVVPKKLQIVAGNTLTKDAGSIIIHTSYSRGSIFSTILGTIRQVTLFEYVTNRRLVASILKSQLPYTTSNAKNEESLDNAAASESLGLLE